MLFAKSRRSRLSHDTSYEGNSKPTPGPSSLPMMKLVMVTQCVRCREYVLAMRNYNAQIKEKEA